MGGVKGQEGNFFKRSRRLASATSGDMFKKSKSKVLVDYASEEDDMSWHYHHSYKVMRRMDRKLKQFTANNEMRILSLNNTVRLATVSYFFPLVQSSDSLVS